MTTPQTNQPMNQNSKVEPKSEAAERRSFEAQAQTEKAARDAEKVVEKTAEASGDAARASREILRRNAETAQYAVKSGFEAGAQSLHSIAQALSPPFGTTNPDPELAEQSAQNIRAMSEASTALARASQESTRVWLDFIQSGVRANLEAFGKLTNCRSVQEMTALQIKLTRENLKRLLDSSEQITETSTRAISDASRAIEVTSVGSRV